MRTTPLAGLAVAWLAACSGPPQTPARPTLEPTEVRRAAWLGNWLRETSGLARSVAWPGILWSHNDSGGDPALFATDTAGRDLGRFTLSGATNHDWEDLALGPCPAGTCLFVAETGDNGEDGRAAAIYRVAEPDPARPGRLSGVERLTFRYPDGPHDVEAIFVAPDSSVHLISKGFLSRIAHYRLPAAAWRGPDQAVAEKVAMPEIGTGGRRRVTGATIAPDGTTVVVLTYRDLRRLRLAADGGLTAEERWLPCNLDGLLPQAEAVAWFDADGTLALSSEAARGKPAQLLLLRCPWPE